MHETGIRGLLVYCSDLSLRPLNRNQQGPLADDAGLFNLEPLAGLMGAELGGVHTSSIVGS